MQRGTHKTCILACSVFQPELSKLTREGRLDIPVHYLPAKLHMKPLCLKEMLDQELQRMTAEGMQVVLVYGECHPYMHEQQRLPNVRRISGRNCIDILIGDRKYNTFVEKKPFYLLPEWARNWQQYCCKMIGLNASNTVTLFQEIFGLIVYLDTGAIPMPSDSVDACAKHFGLPFTIVHVPLERLYLKILRAVRGFSKQGLPDGH